MDMAVLSNANFDFLGLAYWHTYSRVTALHVLSKYGCSGKPVEGEPRCLAPEQERQAH
jgi:hypothetical protein